MEFLDEILLKDADYASLLREIQKNRLPIVCTGLSSIHKAVLLKGIVAHTGKKITVVTEDEASALELCNDATQLGIKAQVFPLRDYCIGDYRGYSKEYEHKRTDTLSKLLDGDFELLCVSVDSA